VTSARAVVVVPTYNEAGNIITLLDRIRRAVPEIDVVVVDDNSPDGTAALVTAHPSYADGQVSLLSRTTKDGLGAAYRAGFGWALDRGYDDIVQMDADLSHPAERIPALLETLEVADVAVGSRYVPGGQVSNWPLGRQLISWWGNLYVRLVLGLAVHDMTAGFKAFRREALVRIGAVDSSSNGYCFQVENTWRAARRGMRIGEVPITFTDRSVGTSKMSTSIVAEALWRVLAWRWAELCAAPAVMRTRQLIKPLLTREVLTFLAVGGTGYVVDVVGFNVLRSSTPLATGDPSLARTIAFVAAMWVTYFGNRTLTWRGHPSGERRREVGLFVLFNVIGFGFSVVALAISHDVFGLTSRLADNVSANVVGVGLGTVFRYLTYKRFVFTAQSTDREPGERVSAV
jgi:dolichol-phosphate mannosyltransferase